MVSSSKPTGHDATAHRDKATAVEPLPLAQPKEEPEDLAEPAVPVVVVQLNEYWILNRPNLELLT